MGDLHSFDVGGKQIADDFGWFEEILSDGTSAGDEGVADFAELFGVGLDLHICGCLKDVFLVVELFNQRTENPFIDFNYQLFEVIAEMYFALTDDRFLAVEYFDHLIDRLEAVRGNGGS